MPAVDRSLPIQRSLASLIQAKGMGINSGGSNSNNNNNRAGGVVGPIGGSSRWRRKRSAERRFKELKVRRTVRRIGEGQCREALASILLLMRQHIALGYGFAGYCNLTDDRLGGGLRPAIVFPCLRHFQSRVEWLLQYTSTSSNTTDLRLNSSRSTAASRSMATCRLFNLQLASVLVRVLSDNLKRFAGQLMLLPLALEVCTGAREKDCRIELEYGQKKTIIAGSQFNGKCSRILLDVHPGCMPIVTLISRKKTMGVVVKEEQAGRVEWELTHCRPSGCGCTVLDLSFTRHGLTDLTARARVQLEWFPKVAA